MEPCRSRRDFLRIAGASLLAPLVEVPLRAAPSNPSLPVSIARCREYEPGAVLSQLQTMMDQLGGLTKLVAGKTVAVKVNLTGDVHQPALGLPGGQGATAVGEFLTPDLAPVELEIIVGGPGSSGSAGGGGGATYVYEVTAPESSTWVMMLIGFAGLGYAGYRASRKTGRAIQRA